MNNTAFIFGLERGVSNTATIDTSSLYKRSGDNTGNFAFHEAIYKQLGVNKHVPWSALDSEINNAGDIGVIPCANQVGSHADFSGFANKLKNVKCKLVSIGLGAQSDISGKIPEVPKGTINWLNEIADKNNNSINISVRGEFTKKVLEKHGIKNTITLGCPSLFINESTNLGEMISNNFKGINKIAVTAGDFNWKSLKSIEVSLASMVTNSHGSYIAQATEEMVRLCRGELSTLPITTQERLRAYICPSMSMEQFHNWSSAHGKVFFNSGSWMEHYRQCDIVVGPRIHGVMLALQTGVPGLCIAHDSRILELCQTMKIPYLEAKEVIDGLDRYQLEKAFLERFDPVEFDRNRNSLAQQYTDFLSKNALNVPAWLKKIANSSQNS